MNKRIRKKHAKQAWERMQKEIRDPVFWKRTDREGAGWSGYVVTPHREENVRVLHDVRLLALSVNREALPGQEIYRADNS